MHGQFKMTVEQLRDLQKTRLAREEEAPDKLLDWEEPAATKRRSPLLPALHSPGVECIA